MKVAFVGVKRKYQELAPEYRYHFNQFHLELPFYYARDGGNDVTITTVDYTNEPIREVLGGGGSLRCQQETQFINQGADWDVVVHWRRWFPEMYKPGAVNVINCQDHSFGPEWKGEVTDAILSKKCRGILCFPTWHKRNLVYELSLSPDYMFDGVTLGVDTTVYAPTFDKDPYQMLWASDPGRGLTGAVMLAIQLFQVDKNFRLHVCYPDYVKNVQKVNHPAIVWHGNMDNSQNLWDIFRYTGVLPFTSTFMEPSSRAHRQAMAAGSMVLYPPDRGSPSELIQNDLTGVVADPSNWAAIILRNVRSGEWKKIGERAREYAISENWAVQATRFNELMERLRRETCP